VGSARVIQYSGAMTHPLTIGVDEAGRGAVLGPLVLAACALDPQTAQGLAERGVADSKGFGPPAQAQQRRAELAEQIRQRAPWYRLAVVSPGQVDAAVRQHGLNVLERRVAADLLRDAPAPAHVVLDGVKLFSPLAARLPSAEARNRAESHCLAVAAASILAKHERDCRFAEIRLRYEDAFGPIRGEGYPNAATKRFLQAYLAAHADLPAETRRSWSWEPVMQVAGPEERGEPPGFDFD